MFTFKKKTLRSESGIFYLDDGIVIDFKPSEDNPIIEEKIVEPNAYYGYVVKKSINHLIVPNGVKGFVDDFFRGITIQERFELPDGLLYIGNSYHDNNSHGCVFAECVIPEVRIPETVTELGLFAFGSSQIGFLKIPSSIRQSRCLRQFKDSHITTLCLPKEWENLFYLDGKFLRRNFSTYDDCNRYLGWLVFDASIDNLVFE